MKLVPLVLGVGLLVGSAQDFKRTEDVAYGRNFGIALTMNVIEPLKPIYEDFTMLADWFDQTLRGVPAP